MALKLYTCTSFTGHNPVGTAAVVLAETKYEAKRLLREELEAEGLTLDKDDVVERVAMKAEVDTLSAELQPGAWILNNGEY